MAKFQRGFKAQANRTAVGIRRQMGLAETDPLDPRDVLSMLSVPVLALSGFQTVCPEAVHGLMPRQNGFSAMIFPVGGGQRLVVHNDAHSPARQNSNLAHELSHILLAHQPEAVCIGDLGRESGSLVEAEAAHLGGCLLVPNEAAHQIMARRIGHRIAAYEYGVSEDMIEYRLRMSGALRRYRQY